MEALDIVFVLSILVTGPGHGDAMTAPIQDVVIERNLTGDQCLRLMQDYEANVQDVGEIGIVVHPACVPAEALDSE